MQRNTNTRCLRTPRLVACLLLIAGCFAAATWALLSTAATAGAAPAALGSPSEAEPTSTRRVSEGERSAVGDESRDWYGAPIGTWLRYEYESTARFGFAPRGDGALSNRSPEVTTTCRGIVEMQILHRDESETITGVTYSDFCFAGGEPVADDPRLAALAFPTLVRLSPAGSILGYRFAEELDGDQRNTQRSIVSTMGFPLPSPLTASWETSCADDTGEYVAHYSMREAEDTLRIRRVKAAYTALPASMGPQPEHHLEGEARATLARSPGWLVEAHLRESLTIPFEVLRSDLQHHAVVKLTLQEFAAHPVDVTQFEICGGLDGTAWQPAGGHGEDRRLAREREERARWQQRLAGADLVQLLAALETLLGDPQRDAVAFDRAWQQLSWFLRLHPEEASAIAERVRSGTATDLTGLLLGALGNAGTRQAQDVIAGVFVDPHVDGDLRNQAAMSMFQIARPTGALLSGLSARLQSLTEITPTDATAVLAFGALAPRAATPDAGGLSELFDLESTMARLGATDLWLQSLGNAGTPEVLGVVRAYLDAPDERVRAAAVSALRDVAHGEAVPVIIDRARHDRAAPVRIQAVNELSLRPDAAARRALHHAAAADPDEPVRRAAVIALWHTRSKDAAGLQLIERIATHDASPSMRAFAAQLLRESP